LDHTGEDESGHASQAQHGGAFIGEANRNLQAKFQVDGNPALRIAAAQLREIVELTS
jgi:hypothetical protein